MILHATLPMYDWPEEYAATDAIWSAFRARLPQLDLPAALTRPDWVGIETLWRDPGLVFSQTCWGPLRLGLSDHLTVLAQPDYSAFPGGRGPLYRSVLVAPPSGSPRKAAPEPEGSGAALPPLDGLRLAFNARDSLSGWIALAEDLGEDPAALATEVVETGGHRASIRAVAEGRADIAAIDIRSWDLARRHEPCARSLAVVGWTAARPGLPYVTSRSTGRETARALTAALIAMGCHPAPEGGYE